MAADRLTSSRLKLSDNVDDCVAALRQIKRPARTTLSADSIRILNWNIAKGRNSGWQQTLDKYAVGSNLVTLQEAILGTQSKAPAFAGFDWSFADGYARASSVSGVATFSRAQPLVRCNLKQNEPWLGVPKAIHVTQYALSGSDQYLLVLNMHAINFTFGLRSYGAQLGQVESVLRDYSGPVILTGDFNTWRAARQELLDQFAQVSRLSVVPFEQDRRVRFLGHAVDHVLYRNLFLKNSTTVSVLTSDHNPTFAEFSLWPVKNIAN